MEILEILWEVLVTSALLYGAAELLPDENVRCRGPESALKVGVLQVLAFRVLVKVAVLVMVIPMLLLLAIPVIGPILVALGALVGGLVLAAASLWGAQLLVDDYRIDQPVTALVVSVGMWALRLALA